MIPSEDANEITLNNNKAVLTLTQNILFYHYFIFSLLPRLAFNISVLLFHCQRGILREAKTNQGSKLIILLQAFGVQSLGITGALRIGAEFLHSSLQYSVFYYSLVMYPFIHTIGIFAVLERFVSVQSSCTPHYNTQFSTTLW